MSENIITKRDKNENENEKTKNSTDDEEDYNDIKKNDFLSMFYDFINNIPVRLSVGMFVLLLLLFSKQFAENVLFPLGGEDWVDGDIPTNKGVIILCVIASLGLILLDMLIRLKIL